MTQNAVPLLGSAFSGYVTASSGNASALTATTDYTFKWSGNVFVNHVMIQNNTGSNIQWELDTPANAGSPVLATGQTLFLEVQTQVLHLYAAGTPNVNGTSASNVVVRGWL